MSASLVRGAVLVLFAFLLVPESVRATTGGPTWVAPLGYEPKTERVYWGLDSQSQWPVLQRKGFVPEPVEWNPPAR